MMMEPTILSILHSSAGQFHVDDPQTEYVNNYHVFISVTTGNSCMHVLFS